MNYILYYFMNGDKSGEMHKAQFENAEQFNNFMECFGQMIEVFSVR